MQIVGSRGAVPAAERASQLAAAARRQPSSDSDHDSVDAARGGVGRPSTAHIALGLVLIIALGWLIAAPSAPAMIVVISALIACVGWGSGPASPLTFADD